MNKNTKIGIILGGVLFLSLASLWAYRSCGGVLASADSAVQGENGPFYRVVVRRIPFSADPTGAGATFEATLLFRGKSRMSSNTFRWDSGGDSNVRIVWNKGADFTIYFGGTPVHGWFVPGQSAHWEYGKER